MKSFSQLYRIRGGMSCKNSLRSSSAAKPPQIASAETPCAVCDTTAQLDEEPVPFVRCATYGWNCPWEQYQKTYQRKGLFAGGIEGGRPGAMSLIEGKMKDIRQSSPQLPWLWRR